MDAKKNRKCQTRRGLNKPNKSTRLGCDYFIHNGFDTNRKVIAEKCGVVATIKQAVHHAGCQQVISTAGLS